jgi:hypothetical protein
VRFLEVQRADLDIDDQNPRLGLGAHDVARQLQRVDRGVAAHEADHGALDRVLQAAAGYQFEVYARRGKAGAGCDDQMGDA